VRCNTCDIYPTLLAIADVKIDAQPPLDGVSLLPLIDGKEFERPKPMGFWDYPVSGISTPSDKWMRELLAAQQSGGESKDKSKLRLDAGTIKKQYSESDFPGHAAWIDGDWKLHRIADKNGGKVRFELYDLGDDREEKTDLLQQEKDRTTAMKRNLEAWQISVVRSLNGKDY